MSDLEVLRMKNTENTKGIPAARSTQHRMILILWVLLILALLIVVILTSLLFMYYKSLSRIQSHLENNDKSIREEMSQMNGSLSSDVQSILGAVKKLEQVQKSNYKSIQEEMSHLKNDNKSIQEEMSHLKNNDKSIQEEMSHLNNTHKSIQEEMSHLKNNDKSIQEEMLHLKNTRNSSCCPTGWTTIGSKCYYLHQTLETWERSREECTKKYSILLILKNKDELDSLLPFMKGDTYWIGLRRDIKDSSPWLWADGTPLTLSVWAAGEPNNADGKEHCAEIRKDFQALNDIPCDIKKHYICKALSVC